MKSSGDVFKINKKVRRAGDSNSPDLLLLLLGETGGAAFALVAASGTNSLEVECDQQTIRDKVSILRAPLCDESYYLRQIKPCFRKGPLERKKEQGRLEHFLEM